MSNTPAFRRRRLRVLVAVGLALSSLAACGSDDATESASSGSTEDGSQATDVRFGYFPNLTHAPAIIGIEKGYFEDEIAKSGSSVEFLDFNSGSDTIDALLNGDLDVTYIGPSPAITAYATSKNVSLISGATSGGASLVVDPSITSPEDLAGKTIASPGLANTQDVALKAWLKEQGYQVSPDGTGDVTVLNQDNSLTVQAFAQGEIDGAWVPEPYAALMLDEGAETLVDEAELWPDGRFVTTHLLVNDDFLSDHPDVVDEILTAHLEALEYIEENGDDAKSLTAEYIGGLTGSQVPPDVTDEAWQKLKFTSDPIADSLLEGAADAEAVGLLEPVDGLADIYNLDPLNALLAAAGEPEVSGPSEQ